MLLHIFIEKISHMILHHSHKWYSVFIDSRYVAPFETVDSRIALSGMQNRIPGEKSLVLEYMHQLVSSVFH